jgi:hypothetical protein
MQTAALVARRDEMPRLVRESPIDPQSFEEPLTDAHPPCRPKTACRQAPLLGNQRSADERKVPPWVLSGCKALGGLASPSIGSVLDDKTNLPLDSPRPAGPFHLNWSIVCERVGAICRLDGCADQSHRATYPGPAVIGFRAIEQRAQRQPTSDFSSESLSLILSIVVAGATTTRRSIHRSSGNRKRGYRLVLPDIKRSSRMAKTLVGKSERGIAPHLIPKHTLRIAMRHMLVRPLRKSQRQINEPKTSRGRIQSAPTTN